MNYLDDKSRKSAVTTERLREMKIQGKKICCITAYDALFARIFEEAGVDLILVGDSLANIVQGKETTLSVTMEEMIYHTKAVVSGAKRPLIVADMPFMSYQVSPSEALSNAGRLLKETGCDAVKLEGCSIQILSAVRSMTEIGIPVLGHLGLTPQSINKFGTYRARGIDKAEADKIFDDALKLEDAGVFAIVLEKIPAELGKNISENLSIPIIGIGAGRFCDGQILVYADMLGININFKPRFVRHYAGLYSVIKSAVENYLKDVINENFPTDKESY